MRLTGAQVSEFSPDLPAGGLALQMILEEVLTRMQVLLRFALGSLCGGLTSLNRQQSGLSSTLRLLALVDQKTPRKIFLFEKMKRF